MIDKKMNVFNKVYLGPVWWHDRRIFWFLPAGASIPKGHQFESCTLHFLSGFLIVDFLGNQQSMAQDLGTLQPMW